jgi:hypothetical protein
MRLSLRSDDFVTYLNDVAIVDYARGQYSNCARQLRQVIEVWQDTLKLDHRKLIRAKYSLADVLSQLGVREEVDRLSSQAILEPFRRLFNQRHAGRDLHLRSKTRIKHVRREEYADGRSTNIPTRFIEG